MHSYTVRAPGTPYHEHDLSDIPWLSLPEAPPPPKTLARYRRLYLAVGIVLGAVAAWAAAQHSSMDGLRSSLDEQLRSLGAEFPSFDLGLSSMRLPGEFADLGDNLFSAPREWLKSKDFTVGRNLSAQGYAAAHPVVLLPGIISTGLESWTTDESSSGFFRKRLWGSATMMRTVVFEKERWIRHISLDAHTGLDPPGIKVRASEGFDGASHFIAGYWIWAKVRAARGRRRVRRVAGEGGLRVAREGVRRQHSA
jgi:phospholipid:diacylglycerol acyltransferase